MSKLEQPAPFTEISRRAALKTGATLVASSGLLKVQAASDPVRFGVIGVGSRGSYLVSRLSRLDGGRCAAVCDVSPEALERTAHKLATNPKRYADHNDLLA